MWFRSHSARARGCSWGGCVVRGRRSESGDHRRVDLYYATFSGYRHTRREPTGDVQYRWPATGLATRSAGIESTGRTCPGGILPADSTYVGAQHVSASRQLTEASIPLAMADLLEQHPRLHGGPALLVGFGAGLAFGAQVVRLPDQPGIVPCGG
ncbi:hypothetical protein GFY24_22045 [Nocardia sp. SYP-A9097]|uniref:3-oxoacyl-[acyl-carrier-protein] synthase III C-terminal domain-containing protein n=1 Tax=Nocardia sp. SYP-A9097 TaxID=2663237 RepID=UPI00129A34F6|nr:3-oxoacyl-[acyl-carrier-protein] synthase III C-terminal domain-containing protein [Nocardia sp. SYP-A9097]MRH90090.1 hypothetical protein [Nocardia sp. SYP-A9097]